MLSDATAIAAGYMHTCAVVLSGDVYCWGYNKYGQLGTGDDLVHSSPVLVSGLEQGTHPALILFKTDADMLFLWPEALALTAGYSHTCSLLIDGSVYCWGGSSFGQLGLGGRNGSLLPRAAALLNTGGLALSLFCLNHISH
jgi:alpha-tubulin suppressor-like RCC1 family protein